MYTIINHLRKALSDPCLEESVKFRIVDRLTYLAYIDMKKTDHADNCDFEEYYKDYPALKRLNEPYHKCPEEASEASEASEECSFVQCDCVKREELVMNVHYNVHNGIFNNVHYGNFTRYIQTVIDLYEYVDATMMLRLAIKEWNYMSSLKENVLNELHYFARLLIPEERERPKDYCLIESDSEEEDLMTFCDDDEAKQALLQNMVGSDTMDLYEVHQEAPYEVHQEAPYEVHDEAPYEEENSNKSKWTLWPFTWKFKTDDEDKDIILIEKQKLE
jgi:hypothetical protein